MTGGYVKRTTAIDRWRSQVYNRTRKKRTGCPYCSGNKVSEKNYLGARNKKLLKEFNYEKKINHYYQKIYFSEVIRKYGGNVKTVILRNHLPDLGQKVEIVQNAIYPKAKMSRFLGQEN